MTTDTLPRPVFLTVPGYNDAQLRGALMARLRAKGLPLKWAPVVAPAARRVATPEPLWPPPDTLGQANGGGFSPEKPSKSMGDSREAGRPAVNGQAERLAYLTTPSRPTRRAGLAGGLEVYRGTYRALCWAPLLFGALLRTPGVSCVREEAQRVTVTIAPEALRPVAELFGFRAPARTVEFLEEAARQRAYRARRCRQGAGSTGSPSGRGEFWVSAELGG